MSFLKKCLVLQSTGSYYKVKTENRELTCRLSGKLRLESSKNTNPVAVGDLVELERQKGDEAIIVRIWPRQNYIIRKATRTKSQTHIIAANISQVLILATLKQPRTSTGFIDRMLATAFAYRIAPVLVFFKTDLLNGQQKKQLQNLIDIYRSLKYTVIATNKNDKKGLEAIKKVLLGKTTLISGHSGTGKSTLLNIISPKLNLPTGSISKKFKKGKHTTTFATMFEMSKDTYAIDTPGIKEFGLVDMQPTEITDYFPELYKLKNNCKYHNCLHINEPGCAVLEALENKKIAEFRYKNYKNMVETV